MAGQLSSVLCWLYLKILSLTRHKCEEKRSRSDSLDNFGSVQDVGLFMNSNTERKLRIMYRHVEQRKEYKHEPKVASNSVHMAGKSSWLL